MTFDRYTGQESADDRAQDHRDPPDILLTNYVMLELVLTRPRDRGLIEAARGLRFLVLDELHTYRGRQGADVALLVRRLRDTCDAADVQCIGTSATMTTEGDASDQRQAVADVATTLFGVPVQPGHVIGETLERITDPAADRTPTRCASGSRDPRCRREDFAAFTADPLATWIEEVFGFEPGSPPARPAAAPPARRRSRRRRGSSPSRPARTRRMRAERSRTRCRPGRGSSIPRPAGPLFAFRLHQFLSKGDNVYVTLEPPAARHVTSTYQVAAPGDGQPDGRGERRPERILVPTGVLPGVRPGLPGRHPQRRPDGGRGMPARRDNDASGGDEASGYLFISDDQPWPAVAGAGAGRGPAAVLLADAMTRKPAQIVDPARLKLLPEPVWVDVTGREAGAGRGHLRRLRAEPVPVLPALPHLLRAGPRQRLRQAGQAVRRGPQLGHVADHGQHRPHPAHLGRRSRRPGAQAAGVRRQPPGRIACRPGTSTTSCR